MEHDFWHERWDTNQIAFHEGDGNALFVAYFPQLKLTPDARVFLPLCGKTRDIHWLLANGYRVAGAELSELAVQQLFAELGVTATVEPVGELIHYSAPDIDIYVGDIFKLDEHTLGMIDAVYDRAALVALPDTLRGRYASHLSDISSRAPQLLITFIYDQSGMDGPPFSVDRPLIDIYYANNYVIQPLESVEIEGGLKKKVAATENAWLIKPIEG